jgi:Domain of unknown function (DUF4175)
LFIYCPLNGTASMSLFIRLRLFFARFSVLLALVWERSAPIVLPAALFPSLYIALALMGLWEHLGDPWRLMALLGSTGAALYYGFYGVRAFRWPNRDERARRLEADAGLTHRPIELIKDVPVSSGTTQSVQLWQAQQERARKDLHNIRPRKPRAAWAMHDVFALRAGAFLLVFAGFILAGPLALPRLDEAFAPRFLSHKTSLVQIDAWVSGPKYALLAPMFLDQASTGPIAVLSGSRFHINLGNAQKKPVLVLRSAGKKRRIAFQKTGPQSYELAEELTEDSVLTLKRTKTKSWTVHIKEDQPPKILFTKPPHGTPADALAFSYAAKDDVGIAGIDLVLERAGNPGSPERTALELPAPNAKTLTEKTELDFTRHRWAGLPVQAMLVVKDGAGQTHQSRKFSLTLPDRLFVNPVAKAIAEQRALLIRSAQPYAPMPKRAVLHVEDVRARPPFAEDKPALRLGRAPAPVRRAAAMMRASIRAPEMFFDDPLVYVGLRYAAENLRLAKSKADYKALDGELWALALWAEGGALADARAALKAAERAFRRALARNAPADELARLMHNYERAVKRYLEALAEEALRRGQTAKGGSGGMDMDATSLQEMLDALKALSETGARGDARKLLQALSALLEKMKMQLTAGSGPGNDAASKAMRKALEELGDITAEQREILDEIFRQQQGQKPGQSAPGEPGKGQAGQGLAGEQKGLGGRLDALAEEEQSAGRQGAAGALKDGAEEMGRAAGALGEKDMDQALQAGKDALSALREGSEALASDLYSHIQKQNGEGDGTARDPFGRPTRGGAQSGEGTSVPDVINAERAREILQLLRDRAAEQGRGDAELDYLDRLLERF